MLELGKRNPDVGSCCNPIFEGLRSQLSKALEDRQKLQTLSPNGAD